MRRNAWQYFAAAAGVALMLGVGRDVIRALGAAPPPAPQPEPPAGALDPSSLAVRPEGKDWAAYLRRAPLTVGKRLPALHLVDQQERRVSTRGKPAVWAVLCGCRDCAMAGSRISDLERESPEQFESVLFVANRSDYVWDRMTQSFGLRTHLIWDKTGSHYRELRAPGSTYSHLPMVWAADRRGVIRVFARPKSTDEGWLQEVRSVLHLRDVPNY